MSENTISPPQLQARFLDGFEIKINDRLIDGLCSQKAKALFAYLLLEPRQLHSRSRLASLFWPDVPDQTALHNLRQVLSTIRKALTECNCYDDLLEADREYLGFSKAVILHVDAIEFENQIRDMFANHAGQPERGFPIHSLMELIQNHTGRLLPDLSTPDSDLFEDWLIVKREAITRLMIEGVSILFGYHTKRCEWTMARKYAELLVSLAPWDEDAHNHLIQILLRLSQANLALTHFHSAVRYFQNDLQVQPGQMLLAAYEDIQSFLSSGKTRAECLPPRIKTPAFATPFIGRQQELITLEYWISNPMTRVISITGPGGSGKTRLAGELANAQNSLFKDGVYFVSIANCVNSEQLAMNILNLVKIASESTPDPVKDMLDWAKNRSALLILDNVEDPREAALFADRLADIAPNLILVFTSYSPLNLIGEKVFALNGLGLTEGLSSDAVKLFYSHLQSEGMQQMDQPDFGFQVLQICELVEGLPLAIDLAACQTRWIPISEILRDLSEKMNLLNSQAANLPERHRSIQASFENVWKHLESRQKHILPLLTIFENPFSIQAADKVCSVSLSELRDLSTQSLLIWDGKDHYRFHRVLRLCASEKSEILHEEKKHTSKNHTLWFFSQLLDLYHDRKGEKIFAFHQTTELILGDVLKALDWLISAQDWDRVKDLIPPLYLYFEGRSLFSEGSLLFESCSEKCSDEPEAVLCKAMFSCRAGLFNIYIQKFSQVTEMIQFGLETSTTLKLDDEVAFSLNAMAAFALIRKNGSTSIKFALEALHLSRKIKNIEEEARSLYNLGYSQDIVGEISVAEETLNSCRILCEQQKDWKMLSAVLNKLADIACYHGDYQLALRHYDQALTVVQSLENKYSESLIMNNIGTAYLELFQYTQAENYFQKSLQLCREITDREGEAIALSNLGEMAAYQKDFENAAKYNQLALEISLQIESDWGEMSTRMVLVEAYRELGDRKAARNELLHLFQLVLKTEAMNFYHRSVVEAVKLLAELGHVEGLSSILKGTITADGTEESIRIRAVALLEKIPEDGGTDEKMNAGEILSILKSKLEMAFS